MGNGDIATVLENLYNAVGTALMLDPMRLMQSVEVQRTTAITLLGIIPLRKCWPG